MVPPRLGVSLVDVCFGSGGAGPMFLVFLVEALLLPTHVGKLTLDLVACRHQVFLEFLGRLFRKPWSRCYRVGGFLEGGECWLLLSVRGSVFHLDGFIGGMW